ncbi:ureidoglycolate lyase [Deinococcus sp.]|uniref:ureidoglycolate lyase n=1 Tax=Deinococcus sp. TaxID=47478 RepID=UPI0028698E9E|nr:ureidoglycolate lyase [Deinococcus sp.]
MALTAQPLTPAAFAPFGEALTWPAADPDASGPGWAWWAERMTLPGNTRPWSVGLLQLTPAPRIIDWAERHAHSAELIVPLDGSCVIYVAPEGESGQPDLEQLRVFALHPGEAALLRPGIWHGAPLAVGVPARVLVLLPGGTGRMDTVKVTFGAIQIA